MNSALSRPIGRQDDAAAQLGELIGRLARQLRRGARKALLPFQLTDSQARALRIVGRAEAPLQMSEIARRIDVVPRSATSVVDVLELRGLVVREIDPNDRRSFLVRLTPAGDDLLRVVSRARDDAAIAMFSKLKAADRSSLLRILSSIDRVDIGPSGRVTRNGGRAR